MENNTLCNRHSLGVNNHTKMYVTYTRIYGWSDYGGESSYQPGYRLENMMWMTLLVYDYIIPGDKNMMNNLLNGMFGKVGNGMCRLSMNGNIAVKTSSGYKTYNLKTGRLTNCDSFVFNIGEEFFFVIPTNKVSEGDIILVNGKPKCVIEAEKNKITVINYEDSTIDTILPERHVFMGNTYFYGKIVSMFGNDAVKGKKGKNNIFKYMMLSQMMNGNDSNVMGVANSNNNMSAMLPFMMMGGNMGEMFDGMFDFDMNDGDEVENTEEEDA